jgi:hypothetical protein
MDLPAMQNGVIRLVLKVSSVSGTPELYFDSFRNYGRTSVDGERIPYELAATLLVRKH